MDPFSVLSIAAAVVQFTEFGYKLLKSTHEIYKSSSSSSSGQTQDQSINLLTVLGDLRNLIRDVNNQRQGISDDNRGIS